MSDFLFVKPGPGMSGNQAKYINKVGGHPFAHKTAVGIIGALDSKVSSLTNKLADATGERYSLGRHYSNHKEMLEFIEPEIVQGAWDMLRQRRKEAAEAKAKAAMEAKSLTT